MAVLLPLSGANAELGKAMLEAAQLALFTTGNDRLTLVPRDTGGTPESAANAARSAITEVTSKLKSETTSAIFTWRSFPSPPRHAPRPRGRAGSV